MLTGAVARFRLDADERRTLAARERLQRRGVLERVRRDDPIVVIGGHDQRGGIADAGDGCCAAANTRIARGIRQGRRWNRSPASSSSQS